MKNYWLLAILKVNWQNLITSKKTFIIMSSLMCAQSLLYFFIWVIFFSRISSLHGWGLREVAFLYGSSGIGYGVFFCLFGGLNKLGQTIESGALDTHLARPRSPLLLVMMERMRSDSLGDITTGLIVLTLFVRPDITDLPLLIALSLSAGLIFFAFRLVAHSLVFWNTSGRAPENLFTAFLIAGTNPQKGFNLYLKIAMLTIFPAGYAAFLPVEILRHFRWDYFALQIGGSLVVLGFSIWLFYYGLRRYTSGNNFLILR